LRQNDQVITRLRSAIADLKCSTAAEAEYEASPVAPSLGTTADVPAPFPEPETAKAEPPETIFAAQLLLGELRNAGQALLREVSALETRLNEEAQLVRATRDYTDATKKAEGAAIVEQQAKELAHAASAQYDAAATERRSADELAASSRTDAETAKAQIAKLERWLQDAHQLAQETSSKLGQHESRAQECAAAEDAARCEAAEAAARVAACQAASVAAVNEARLARERAEALKQALPQSAPSFAGISNVQTIATRIVEEAAALTNDSRATQRDPLEDTAQLQW
jgi:chromosome segregation ATPase